MATHTYTHRLGGRAVNTYFVHHAEVIRCEHKMVYYFHVRRIQHLLQMVMAQGFFHGRGARMQLVGWLAVCIILILVHKRP